MYCFYDKRDFELSHVSVMWPYFQEYFYEILYLVSRSYLLKEIASSEK